MVYVIKRSRNKGFVQSFFSLVVVLNNYSEMENMQRNELKRFPNFNENDKTSPSI